MIGLFLLAWPFLSQAEDVDFISFFKQKAESIYPEAVQMRRQLHRCPELCFQEKETAAIVAGYLESLGLEVKTGIGGYGIKAVLAGARPGPVIAIRSDLDALPIEEKTGLDFASKNRGVMHACGHDVHITNVLMAARLLAEVKDRLAGTVVFIFQPCEEGAPLGRSGGAETMIAAGVLDNPRVDAILALHVFPGLPAGVIGIRKGAIMANVASFYISIFGKASHGAFPHQGIDAIYAAASAIMQFQALISRFRDPMEPAVLTVGKVTGGVRLNVIADRVDMDGTVRSFSFAVQDQISMGIEKILKGLEIALDIRYRFDFEKDAPYVKNDDNLTAFLAPLFEEVLGKGMVREVQPLTVAEDFSLYSHRIPALLFLLGVGDQAALHTPEFTVDETVLKIAPVLFASAAVHYLEHFPPN
jgi:amidohydrolase